MPLEKTIFHTIFGDLKDHRVNRTKLHSMENIIFITISAVISGCDTWDEIEDFGKNKKEWLSRYLDLENGIPSHDTFNRFFSLMDIEAFENCFRKWVNALVKDIDPGVVAIDGKAICGSKGKGMRAIHMVSAWSNNAGITLGQLKVDDKKRETAVIPDLLDMIMIERCVVTVDAFNTQPGIAEKILEKGADYIMPIKGNRKHTLRDMEFVFANFDHDDKFESIDETGTRRDTRKISVMKDLSGIRNLDIFPSVKSIVRLETENVNKKTGEIRIYVVYYISNLDKGAEFLAKSIRSHWGIENNLHWMLDVSFGEDDSRKINRNAVVNFSLVNKIAASALKKDTTCKLGLVSKRKKAALSDEYREAVMKLLEV